MNSQNPLRHGRPGLLDAVGIEEQDKLLASGALIVSSGGLGSPAARRQARQRCGL